uniref:Putative secreted peptide n=1 Tax=Anopheles braziliensis TaxID=58242 RepID=A0A2M3ZU80_9DIPT
MLPTAVQRNGLTVLSSATLLPSMIGCAGSSSVQGAIRYTDSCVSAVPHTRKSSFRINAMPQTSVRWSTIVLKQHCVSRFQNLICVSLELDTTTSW